MLRAAQGSVSSVVMGSIKQLPLLLRLVPSLPTPPCPEATVPASDVPALFREPYILSGYRPVGQPWPCYVLSLFQCHNESLNVWTHLLASGAVLLRFALFASGAGREAVTLPLCLYAASALTYLSCSATAHLLQSHSELAHYSLFFLDYMGVGAYQYGCALAHYFHCSEEAWKRGPLGPLLLPLVFLFSWMSCASCCFAKLRYRRPYPFRRKLFQIVPTGLSYILVISPVVHRLASQPWTQPALLLHALHMAFFLQAAFFFAWPVLERLFPGRCDIVGQAHQIFHVFMILCTMCQLEAVCTDVLQQRGAALPVHEHQSSMLAGGSFFALVLCCALTAALMSRRVQRQLQKEE
ncbi:membrane progestin receptor beta [Electrophorus electricus]|uniref:membrane progestin receptor beta n=1 Tax=Electrophorus electricus TaxID=8005 RepID=UPI0015D04E22|nr:membrane progestin receptor beta [Electrophorus electricus]